jgi:hypothetical protein
MSDEGLRERHRERYQWMENLLADPRATDGDKVVGIALALHKNLKMGRCDPAIATLAAETARTRQGAQKSIRNLERLGHVRTRLGGYGPKDTNGYDLISANGGLHSCPPIPPEMTKGANHGEAKGKPKGQQDDAQEPTTFGPNNQNNQNIEGNTGDDGDGGDGGRASELKSVVDKVAQLAGLPADRSKWPKHWANAVPIVAGWRERFPDELILMAVEWAMRVKPDPGKPPSSITYFDKPIRQRFAAWTAPLPGTARQTASNGQAAAPSRREHQQQLGELAQRLGWHVVAELAESEADELSRRLSRGQVTDEELHRIKLDTEARLFGQGAARA